MENKYFFISRDKEFYDTEKLVELIKQDNWVDSETIIVTCSPDYSSSLSMILNHRLSHLNYNELFAQVKLELPYPIMNQVWNDRLESEAFDVYLKDWNTKHLYKGYKYLFVESGITSSKAINKVKLTAKDLIDNQNFKFATLYLQDDTNFLPDYVVERFNFEKQGGLLFSWENANNNNWNY